MINFSDIQDILDDALNNHPYYRGRGEELSLHNKFILLDNEEFLSGSSIIFSGLMPSISSEKLRCIAIYNNKNFDLKIIPLKLLVPDIDERMRLIEKSKEESKDDTSN